MDWNAAYSNVDHVANAASFPARWQEEAATFRTAMTGRAQLNVAYGPGARERYDLFQPEGPPKGLAVFVHGGYWHKHDKAVFSAKASGALTRGWAVAMIGYTLCPDVRIRAITTQIQAAVIHAAGHAGGPIALSGHSAGGHLATRMMCEDIALPEDVAQRICNVVSISGVHDLRPLLRTQMNNVLGLDAREATAESPVLALPRPGTRITCWVGGAELPEFRRQNALLANIWTGMGAEMTAHEAPGKNHFNVIEELSDPQSALVQAWLED
ncbi:MAG: alpha/beta hydrolase [Paracoccaceae bacterium]